MKDKFNIRNFQNSFLLIIIICLLISSLTKRDSYITLTSCLSKIILKINVSGNQKVLSPDYQGSMPDSVFLNGSSIELENSKEYAFSSSFNIIELNWNDGLISCAKMFSGCSNIIEIDLSQLNQNNVRSFNNMFENCFSLTSINISNLNTSTSDDMSYMFHNCSKIKSLDLSSFDTHLVTKMDYMFSGGESLEYLNISSFNTPKLVNIIRMFHNCKLLNSLDLSNFDTSLVANMSMIFENCEKLIHLDIKFNTSNAVDMKRLFYNCRSLSSLNVSTFDTSNVWMMVNMFGYCESLKSLDLSSFNAKSIRNMHSMFSNCYSLTSLNLSNFIDPPLNNINGIFENDYNLEYLDISHFDTSKVTIMSKSFKNCKSLKSLNLSNFNTLLVQSMEQMFLNCSSIRYLDLSNFNTSIVTDMSKMFSGCNNLIYINLKNSIDSKLNKYTDIFKNTPEIMIFCINEDLNSKLFNFIKDNKSNSTLNCSENIDINYFPEIIFSTDTLLLSSIIDINEKIIMSTFTNFANSALPMEISELSSIVQPLIIKCTFNYSINTCILPNMENINNNEEIHDIIVDNLLRSYSGIGGLNQIIEGKEKIIYQLTNSENELNLLKNKSLNNNNLSIIDLGECEDILRKEYHINQNDSLIILKQENISKTKSSEKNVQFEVYEPYNKRKLNLTICGGTRIKLYTKMVLSQNTQKTYNILKELGYDMFNINDKFYQDICTPYQTENNTDILLSDRIDYIYNNEDTQCQPNCEFIEYFLETQHMCCFCSVNEVIPEKKEKFSPKKLYESFYEVLKYSNYKVYKCYNLVFIKRVLTKNAGGIIIFVLSLIDIICFVIYFIKKESSLKAEILNLNKDNNKDNIEDNIEDNNKDNNENNNNSKVEKKDDIIINEIVITKNNNVEKSFPPKKRGRRASFQKHSKNIFDNKKFPNGTRLNYKRNTSKIEINNDQVKSLISQKNSYEKSKIFLSSKEILDENIKKEIQNDINIIEINKDINKEKQQSQKLSDFELNDLEYEEAVKLDKRTFIQIYFATLKREHIILFTFFSWNDYNLFYIKIARLIFLLSTDISMNIFFFSDDSMHKLFLNYGKYDFIQQIPQVVYSTIISQILEVFLCYLSMTDKYIYQIKNSNFNSKDIIRIFKCINIKLLFFFIFTFTLFIFYWYSVASFCAVYENSQITFVKDSFLSFLLSIIYPFIIYLITTALRFCAIKKEKKGLKFVYRLSDIIPFF